MASYRPVVLLIALLVALLTPRPAEAQNLLCDISAILPEVISPYRVRERDIFVGGHTLRLRFCAPSSQSIVADEMLDLAERALPVLQQLTDVRLDGSHSRTFFLDESANVIGYGYDGYIDQNDRITLHKGSREATVVHELAHYWADRDRFREPWLVEAYAEYLTSLAMPRLGLPFTSMGPAPDCEHLPLIEWVPGLRDTEVCAYATGPQVLHALAAEVGEDTLRQVIGELSREGGVKSELLLTRLERVSLANLTPLMRDRVFEPATRDTLNERAAVRQHFIEATQLAQSLEITLPQAVADDLNAWRHRAAGEKLAQLEPVLASAAVTRQRCSELGLACVPVWEQLGPDSASWQAVSYQLAGAPQLLSAYEDLGAVASGLAVDIPADLTAIASELNMDRLPELQVATSALLDARELEEACAAVGLDCRNSWLNHWARGDVDAAADSVAQLKALLAEGAKLETACGGLAGRCRELWREAFLQEGMAVARTLIGESGQIVVKARDVEAECAAAGWPCAAGWRTALAAGGPAEAGRILDAQAAALPRLKAVDDELAAPELIAARPTQQGAAPAVDELAEVRRLFEQGNVVTALQRAEGVLAARSVSRLVPYGAQLLIALLLGGLLLAITMRLWPRQAVRRQPAAVAKAGAGTPAAADLLTDLLARPPSDGGADGAATR